MGKRGPTPMPTALRILHKEKNRDRYNELEPTPRPGRLEIPPDVSDEVAELWSKRVIELEAMGIAYPADIDAWRAYCEAVVIHEKACRVMARSPLLVEGATGIYVRNPVIQIQRDAALTLLRFAAHFGLTPSARAQVQTAESRKTDANPFAGTG